MAITLGEARLWGEVHGALNLAVSWYDGTISLHQFISETEMDVFCKKHQLTFIEESSNDDSNIEG
jgi:hypothetical protein